VIDAKDAIFNSFQLWVDANQDGVTQNGELHALTEYGVQAIHLAAQSGTTLDNGNLLGLVSQWTGTDGKTHDLADVWFTTTNLSAPERMVALAQKVDLSALGIHSYELHLSDVLVTANSTVLINAGANDVVKVDQAGWHDTGLSASLNQHVYSLWENGKAYLLVDQQAHVQAVL
jgi:hypothetical protein